MRGLMMDRPLLISGLIDYAADVHQKSRVVSNRVEGDIHRYTYPEARARIAQLAHGLRALGVGPGDRVATIAWNGYRHFELYYALAGIGAICHTINPRLFPDQIAWIVNHAEDRLLFVDLTFLPLAEALADKLPTVEHVLAMTDRAHLPETPLAELMAYEDLLDGQPDYIVWPEFDENTAAGLCYTSGTTGNPKGVLYSHRSSVLHALSLASLDALNLTQRDRILPVVPLFHVNAWGLPYACPLTGTDLVFPGPGLDGASLFDLMDGEGVTSAWGVPTIWLGLLGELEKRGRTPKDLEMILTGGSAAARSLIEALEGTHGLRVVHGWGMTEMSPVGTVCLMRPDMDDRSDAERFDVKMRQGRRQSGCEMKIVDEAGAPLPHDGEAHGELLVRGNYIAGAYDNDAAASAAALDDGGWFRTGDVATIDADGYMMVVDRTKDMIKSGGEWISSIDLENAAIGHPGLALAAVIGLPHPKWDERPLLVAVRREGAEVSDDDIRQFLADKVASWWLPDAVEFVDALPMTATGKVKKAALREQYKDYVLPTIDAAE